MKEVTEIRQLNLKKLEVYYGSQVALADILGSTPARVNHLLTGHRNIGEKVARKFELALKKPQGWMDSIHDDSATNNPDIIDLSKYNEDQQRVIRMLLGSFDSSQGQENNPQNKQNNPLTTPVQNVGGGMKPSSSPNRDNNSRP
jgi:hypothetical protein